MVSRWSNSTRAETESSEGGTDACEGPEAVDVGGVEGGDAGDGAGVAQGGVLFVFWTLETCKCFAVFIPSPLLLGRGGWGWGQVRAGLGELEALGTELVAKR